MITPKIAVGSEDVAAHYDDLDRFYRRLWGDHVHHGLWIDGRERPEKATEQLIDTVAAPLAIRPGARICDVGCGYGGTSRYLVKNFGAVVTGLTLSQAQVDYAQSLADGSGNPTILLRNWEQNGLEAESFDGLVSIECLAHVENKARFFTEIRRVLKPGARAVITAWLCGDHCRPWERRHLMEPICREGRLPGMGTRGDYFEMINEAGLCLSSFQDLSPRVRKTWSICARRAGIFVLTSPEAWRFLLGKRRKNGIFLATIPRILLAYRTGAMRYGLFVLRKPRAAA